MRNGKRVLGTFGKVQRSAQLIIMAAALGACTAGGGNSGNDTDKSLQRVPLAQLQLQQAEDCNELKDYVTQSLIQQYASIPRYMEYYACPPLGGGMGGGPPSTATPQPGDQSNLAGGGSSSDAAPVPGDVSDTNNQEQGVNEGDIVKADDAGNVYVLTGRHFIVADGFPPQNMNELARIDLGGRGLNLFLDKANQRVVILARYDQPFYITNTEPTAADETASAIYPKPEQDYTVVLFYDVSNPADPLLTDQLQLQGYFREGRRLNNRLHLVSNHYLRPTGLYEDSEFWRLRSEFINAVYKAQCDDLQVDVAAVPAVIDAQNKLKARISDIVNAVDPSTYTPDAYRVSNGNKEPVPYLACSDIHYPQVKSSLGLQLITSVDTDGANLQAAGIVNNSYITYVSQNNLYLAETSRNWWWRADNGGAPAEQTAIYKFAISADAPQYVATGRIDGYVNNQFSLSEYNDVLRVATTQNDLVATGNEQWQWVRKNHLSVLSDNGNGGLDIVGEVRDFAPGESIRSARFLGDRGFVVTFRSVDPLFTFDLTQPKDPIIKGELTIPGFSTYMHPYDDTHLITIGRAGGIGGVGTGNGVQLQLVDVSDMANPQVVASYVPDMPTGWSWSSAEYDHKAFTFYQPAGVLAIPMQVYPGISSDVFSGVVAFKVTLDGFTELGRVDHSDLAYQYYCLNNPSLMVAYEQLCSDGNYYQWAAPRRSIVMTDVDAAKNVVDVYLYTLSDVGLKASSIYDLSTILGGLTFPPQPYPWWYFKYYPVGVSDPVPMAGSTAPAPVQ